MDHPVVSQRRGTRRDALGLLGEDHGPHERRANGFGEVDVGGTFDGGDGGGGGGGGPNLQTTGSVGDEIRDSGDRVVFRIENTGSSQVTVEEWAVDITLANNVRINDGATEELEIRRATQTGFANRDSNGNADRFEADGTLYDIVADSTTGQYADVAAADDTVEVDIRTFDTDLGTLEIADSAANADVTVTLVLSDGDTQEFYFRQR